MTHEERAAYVRGVLAACAEFKATMDATAQVCRALRIGEDELRAFGAELEKAATEKGAKK